MHSPNVSPALTAGATFGTLATLPIVAQLNAVCHVLYLGGGVLAALLYLRGRSKTERTPYDEGVVVGMLAGLFGAVVQTVVDTILRLANIGAGHVETDKQQMAEAGVELPAWVMDVLGMSGVSAGSVLLDLVGNAVLFAIFGAIGGLIGVALFYRKDA